MTLFCITAARADEFASRSAKQLAYALVHENADIAPFVGANTVYGPGPERVDARFAVVSPCTKYVRPRDSAVWSMVNVPSVVISVGGIRTEVIGWITPSVHGIAASLSEPLPPTTREVPATPTGRELP